MLMASQLHVDPNNSSEGHNEECEIQDQPELDGMDKEGDEDILSMSKETIMGMLFESLEDAENFYRKYARVNGFGVRMDDIYWNKEGEPQSRRMVCSSEGKRKTKYIEDPERRREHRTLTQLGCTACMRVRKNKDRGVWEVFRFDDIHNHRILAPEHVAFHRCHRRMAAADAAQVDTMQSYGFRGAEIYGYIVGQAGGYDKPGFIKKDLYNHIDRERRLRMSDGDAMAALHYLQGKVDTDPKFFMKYSIDSDGCLEHLFWADSTSVLDYRCFGDVLAFDSTYKKNKYDRPVVVFSGVNHHRNTVVFGCAIVASETEDTYKWLLQALLEANDGKEPMSVITDGDPAMRSAINYILPRCTHRLCAWHLQRNATSNIGDPQFTKCFKDCMFGDLTIAQFEQKWRSLIENFGVEENEWVERMYTRKTMWAAAYLHGKMFVGLRTTSLCEGMNAQIKKFVKRSHNLVDFVHHFQRALDYFRYNELATDYKSVHGKPVLTTALESIERSGAKVYTKEAFWIFRREIKMSGACVSVDCKQRITTKTYLVKRFMNPENVWSVHVDRQQEVRIRCECGKLQSFGIPCQHIIFVMVQEDIDNLPPSLLVRRWMKNAKILEDMPSEEYGNAANLARVRYGALTQECRLMCNLGSQNIENFLHVRDGIRTVTNELHERKLNQAVARNLGKIGEKVLDPLAPQAKGRPPSTVGSTRRKRRCALCREEGHTSVTCPLGGSRHIKSPTEQHYAGDEAMSSEDDMDLNPARFDNLFINSFTGDNLHGSAHHFVASPETVEADPREEVIGLWTLNGKVVEDQEHTDDDMDA